MLNHTFSHSPHSGAVHVLVRWSGPSQGSPPYWLGCRILLVEVCQPIPQLAEQGLHWDQLDHWQSTAGGQNRSQRDVWGSFSWVKKVQPVKISQTTSKCWLFQVKWSNFFCTIQFAVYTTLIFVEFALRWGQDSPHKPPQYWLSDVWTLWGPCCVYETKNPHNGLPRQWLMKLLPYLRQLVVAAVTNYI